MKRMKLRLAFLGVALFVGTACSLIVDTDADQCTSDGDCAGFALAVCRSGVCVSLTTIPDSGFGPDGAPLDAGCTPKVPVTQEDILNEPCTSSQCIDFDNCARLGMCDGGALPALVAPPDGGV